MRGRAGPRWEGERDGARRQPHVDNKLDRLRRPRVCKQAASNGLVAAVTSRPGGGFVMRCLRKRGGRFARDTRGATAVEFAMVIGPMLLLAFGTFDFALLLWRTASLDNAALVLHKEIRSRTTPPGEYQAAFCRAAGSLVSCDDGALTLRVTSSSVT